MTIEHAAMRAVHKPWGSHDLRPWSAIHQDGNAIGELLLDRASPGATEPALLLKLLFTKQALSIQVHPDDAFARTIGLANGKSEAWYILAAKPGAEVAVGLKHAIAAPGLRTAIEDGSIEDLVQWHPVREGDVVSVPAGTIHAIGAGLVIAEIQQRSDATFRIFDHGRARELHLESAIAVATAGPAEGVASQQRLTDARTLLVACPQFVLERIELARQSAWALDARRESWLLVLGGTAQIGALNAYTGDGIFLEGERARIKAGPEGLTFLLAYADCEPVPALLQSLDRPIAGAQGHAFRPPLRSPRAPAPSGSRA